MKKKVFFIFGLILMGVFSVYLYGLSKKIVLTHFEYQTTMFKEGCEIGLKKGLDNSDKLRI
ncbi:MAG TPA: hypothetical protein PLJ21_06255 [Pseudobdellovibrionaceae bacterium]|nr:hypothetical protein [Pseudobdellovibrionaceae bacterium]